MWEESEQGIVCLATLITVVAEPDGDDRPVRFLLYWSCAVLLVFFAIGSAFLPSAWWEPARARAEVIGRWLGRSRARER